MGAERKVDAIEAETQDEIAEIMNEIENLQKMAEQPGQQKTPSPKLQVVPPAPAAVSEPNSMEDFKAGADDVSLEETLGTMKEEPAANTILDAVDSQVEEVVDAAADHMTEENEMTEPTPMPSKMSNVSEENMTPGCMTMTLQGNMTLKLKYDFEGQEVIVSFEDQSLRVQLSNGTEFKIPVGRMSKAA